MKAQTCQACEGRGIVTSPESQQLACSVCWGTGSDAADQVPATAPGAFAVRFLGEHLGTVRQVGADFGQPMRDLLMRLYERNPHFFLQAVTAIEQGKGAQVVATLQKWGRERGLA